jgi:hypothetical protein
MGDLGDRLLSRKFLSMVFGILVAIGNAALGYITPQDAMNAIVALIGIYTAAEGLADTAGRYKPAVKTDPAPAPTEPVAPPA